MFRRKREESHIEDHSVTRDIALIAAGIGIGSGIALLAAPNSGEEIRHAIGRRYRHTVRRLGRRTEDLRDRLEDLIEHANDLRSSRLRRFLLRRFLRRHAIERLRAA
jgi:gas vesicle protein